MGIKYDIEFNGITDTIAGWARRLGHSKQGLTQKIDRWGVEIALSVPKGTHVKRWLEYPMATKQAIQESIQGFEQKIDGLSEILHERRGQLGIESMFSTAEAERIAAIKARRSMPK